MFKTGLLETFGTIMFTRKQGELACRKNESGIQRRAEVRGSVTPETGREAGRIVAWTPEEFPFLDLILSPIL